MEALTRRGDQLKNSLRKTIQALGKGQDQKALKHLLNSLEDLENLLLCDYYIEGSEVDGKKLLVALGELLITVKNRDVAAMTDMLKFNIYPMIEKWTGEWSQ